MNPFWLIRLTRWARNPPSGARLKLVLVVVAITLVLYGIDQVFGWPDWLTPNRMPRGRLLR